MPDVVVNLPELHQNQLTVSLSPARFKIARCGRRWGKSKMAIGLAMYKALVGNRKVWWAVPTHKNALAAWEELMNYGYSIPGATVNREEKEVRFPGGGLIRVVSMQEYNNVRGSAMDFLIFDECAFAAEEAYTQVLLPMLLDVEDSEVLFISTPNGFNWFWKLWQSAVSDPEWALFHFSSWDNPFLPRNNLEIAQRKMTPQVYAQEIMADFVDSAGAVFSNIMRILQPEPPPFDPTDAFVMGVDWGRKHDFTAISVMDATLRAEVKLERFNQIGFAYQAQIIQSIAADYGVSTILAEENGIGLPNVERLQDMGLPVQSFKMTGTSKKPLIEALALAIDQENISLLDDPAGNDELLGYRATVTPGGIIKYSAPDGGFDDTVIARALAYHAMGSEIGDIIDISDLMGSLFRTR